MNQTMAQKLGCQNQKKLIMKPEGYSHNDQLKSSCTSINDRWKKSEWEISETSSMCHFPKTNKKPTLERVSIAIFCFL